MSLHCSPNSMSYMECEAELPRTCSMLFPWQLVKRFGCSQTALSRSYCQGASALERSSLHACCSQGGHSTPHTLDLPTFSAALAAAADLDLNGVHTMLEGGIVTLAGTAAELLMPQSKAMIRSHTLRASRQSSSELHSCCVWLVHQKL